MFVVDMETEEGNWKTLDYIMEMPFQGINKIPIIPAFHELRDAEKYVALLESVATKKNYRIREVALSQKSIIPTAEV